MKSILLNLHELQLTAEVSEWLRRQLRTQCMGSERSILATKSQLSYSFLRRPRKWKEQQHGNKWIRDSGLKMTEVQVEEQIWTVAYMWRIRAHVDKYGLIVPASWGSELQFPWPFLAMYWTKISSSSGVHGPLFKSLLAQQGFLPIPFYPCLLFYLLSSSIILWLI